MANPVKFQILSDLHLETHPSYDYDFPQTAPYLALLGDIGHVERPAFLSFLRLQLARFRVVVSFLFGNHEPYHLSMEFAKKKMKIFMADVRDKRGLGEFVFLDRTRFDVNDEITVLGCTLHSRVLSEQARAVQSRKVDFRDILHWDVGEHVDAHIEDLEWLNESVAELAQAGKKIVIFTHHCPTRDPRASHPKFRNSEVWSGFASDLSESECWKNPAVVLWGFGHTHFNCDFIDDIGKRVVSSQKGYYTKLPIAFRPCLVLKIEASQKSRSDPKP